MLEKNFIPASELVLVEAEELGASTDPPGLAARTTGFLLLLPAPITATLKFAPAVYEVFALLHCSEQTARVREGNAKRRGCITRKSIAILTNLPTQISHRFLHPKPQVELYPRLYWGISAYTGALKFFFHSQYL